MIKRHIIETMEEFDEHGKLISRVTTDTTEDDDSPDQKYITLPYTPQEIYQDHLSPRWSISPFAPYKPSSTGVGDNMGDINTTTGFITELNKALSNTSISLNYKGE